MYFNQMVAMTACGLWHGASLNFIVWGVLHGALVCVHKFWSQTVLKSFYFCIYHLPRSLFHMVVLPLQGL